MAGKATQIASPRIAYALDSMSKNALIDLVVDMSCGAIGEGSNDDAVAASIQPHVNAVCRVRKDKPVSLHAMMQRRDEFDRTYRQRQEESRAAIVRPTENDRELAAMVKQTNDAKLSARP